MQQVLTRRDAVRQNRKCDFQLSSARTQHVSYNAREQHVIDAQNKLMKKFRLGYSQLVKLLILKAEQQEFIHPFI